MLHKTENFSGSYWLEGCLNPAAIRTKLCNFERVKTAVTNPEDLNLAASG
jgi:hypothetical protein